MGFSIVKNKIIISGAFFFCFIMVIFPEITANAAKEAIGLWLNAIVPTLFPFLILSNFIKMTGAVRKIPARSYPAVMAFLSGYPMGARIAGDFYREGCIDELELQNILSYSMITGPAFIIGAVGIEFFHSDMLGYILAISHYAGAWVNGLLYGAFFKSGGTKSAKISAEYRNNYYDYLTDSILDSFKTIGIILAYIILFMIATDLLQFAGFYSFFKRDYIAALGKGIMEMTVGCNNLKVSLCSMRTKMICASFLISFGGLSVLGQSMSMLKRCPVSFVSLLKMKFSHGMISGILTFTIYAFVV